MIGILGGTFDPVHNGHLRPALEVMQSLQLAEMRFIPNRVPPHREPPWLGEAQRAALLETALRDQPGFVLDTRELEREGPSYMVDTLESLRAERDETLCLVLGVDAFLGLPTWHAWRRIPELAHLVVTARPGFALDASMLEQLPAAIAHRASDLASEPAGRILLQSVTQLDISSTLIRTQLQQGKSIRYLLPDAVIEQLNRMVND